MTEKQKLKSSDSYVVQVYNAYDCYLLKAFFIVVHYGS